LEDSRRGHPSTEDDRAFVKDVTDQLTTNRRTSTPLEIARLRQYIAIRVLPDQPTARVREKHAQHVEDDRQWPDDVSPDDYLESLRDTVLSPRSGNFLAEAELESTWTIYFVGPVPYRWRGRHPGRRIVILFNAEYLFWITGFQAEGGDSYVSRRPGFWIRRPR
jgi:hypothetical protein